MGGQYWWISSLEIFFGTWPHPPGFGGEAASKFCMASEHKFFIRLLWVVLASKHFKEKKNTRDVFGEGSCSVSTDVSKIVCFCNMLG